MLCLIYGFKIGYSIPKKKFARIMTKTFFSSALMGIFIMYFQYLTLLALVPLATLLYFVVLYVIRGIDKEDINLVRSIVWTRAKTN
jgi:hypothetical protein